MAKDLLEKSSEPDLNIKAYLADSYLHPILRSFEVEEELVELERVEVRVDKHQTHHVSSPTLSGEPSSPSPPHHVHQHQPSPPHYNDYPTSPQDYYYQPPLPPHYVYQYHNQP